MMKKYPEYKDSGMKWLGEVPEHWEVMRLKYIVKANTDALAEGTDPEYIFDYLDIGSVGTGKIVEKPKKLVFNKAPSRARRIVKRNDIIISTVRTYLKATYHFSEDVKDLIVSTGFAVLSPIGVLPGFLGYFVQSDDFINEVIRESVGASYPAINTDRLVCIPITYPYPEGEQTHIVKYLDWKTKMINKYIKKKRKLIEYLKEYKKGIIDAAVTGKIDVREWKPGMDISELKPYPRYKDSGVEWLGEVPKHWEAKPGRALLHQKKDKNTGMQEKTVLSLSYGKIVIKPKEKLHGLVPESFETYQIVNPGDIIIRPTDLQNDWVSLRVGYVEDKGIITSAYLCLTTETNLESYYGYLLLHCYDLIKVFYGLGSGLRQNLSYLDFKYLPIILPSTEEQKQIISFAVYMNKRIDEEVERLDTQIELIKEYRTRLISDVVTGKIDVRDVEIPDHEGTERDETTEEETDGEEEETLPQEEERDYAEV